MSLTFWDTVRGHELADTLIRHLPKLAKRKKQYTITVMEDDLAECIKTELEKGHLERDYKHYYFIIRGG